jgi:hypothetical protein
VAGHCCAVYVVDDVGACGADASNGFEAVCIEDPCFLEGVQSLVVSLGC